MSVPSYLETMRAITGTSEAAGGADNPKILAMRDAIAKRYPDMRNYCANYTHDSIPWCGLTVAYCMAESGIRPPFNPHDDLESFLWVDAWDDFGIAVQQPQPGDVLVFKSPHHVSLYEGEDGGSYLARGGNQSDAVNVTRFAKSGIKVIRRASLPAKAEAPVKRLESNFSRCHEIIAKWEGGFSQHPDDPGGATNFGITIERLSQARGRQVSVQEVKDLTFEEALEIFREYYWDPMQCDEMPVSLALMAYNAGVNSGPSRGIRFLQQALNQQDAGLDEDGEVGPLTIAAALACDDIERAVEAYSLIYEQFYRNISTFPTFGRGWLNRLKDVTEHATEWADERPEPPPIVVEVPSAVPGSGSPLLILLTLAIMFLRKDSAMPDPSQPQRLDLSKIVDFLEKNPELIVRLLGAFSNRARPVVTTPLMPVEEEEKPASPVEVVKESSASIDTRAGILGVLASLAASFTGFLGTPVGPEATTAGALTPLIVAAAAALGIPSPLVKLAGRLFSVLRRPK